MKTQSFILVIIFIGILSACGQKQGTQTSTLPDHSTGPASAAKPVTSSGPSSQVMEYSSPQSTQYTSPCPDIPTRDKCKGAYGFVVFNDGRYRVGPGPNGQVFYGTLSPEHMKDFQLTLHDAVTAISVETTCQAESLTLKFTNRTVASCHPKLLETFHSLIDRYYPELFPNPCADANKDLNRFEDQVRYCSTDLDCGLLNSELYPIDPHSRNNEPLTTDDCSYISPLVTANIFRAAALQKDLLMKRDLTRKACGEYLLKPGCQKIQFVKSWNSVPQCLGGKCKLQSIETEL